MNEYIQKNGDEVAIVIYDAPLPPKYFRLTKRFIKTLFVVVPVLFVIIFLGLFLWGFGTRLKEVPVPELPTVVDESAAKLLALESEVSALKASNQELVDKLSSTSSSTTGEEPYLMAIKKPYGMQNLINQNKVALDQFQFIQDAQKVTLKFQIISSSPDNRVTGHVLVFMMSPSGLMVYPSEANSLLAQGIKYSMGESFAVSRLRPTDAVFDQHLGEGSVRFMIYIFSREGDLLLIKETESFKVSNKS